MLGTQADLRAAEQAAWNEARNLPLLIARLKDKLRPQDVVARLGGDEFAVLARELDFFWKRVTRAA